MRQGSAGASQLGRVVVRDKSVAVVVTFSGHKYVKKDSTTDTTLNPQDNTADWDKSSASADKTNSRMSGGLGSANLHLQRRLASCRFPTGDAC